MRDVAQCQKITFSFITDSKKYSDRHSQLLRVSYSPGFFLHIFLIPVRRLVLFHSLFSHGWKRRRANYEFIIWKWIPESETVLLCFVLAFCILLFAPLPPVFLFGIEFITINYFFYLAPVLGRPCASISSEINQCSSFEFRWPKEMCRRNNERAGIIIKF